MKKRLYIWMACLLLLTALLLGGCKSDTPLSPGGTGGSKADAQTNPNPITIGTNIGLSDIERVQFTLGQDSYDIWKDEGAYRLKAAYQDEYGTHQVDAEISAEEWNQITGLLNGIVLAFPESSEGSAGTGQSASGQSGVAAGASLQVSWRGQKASDAKRVAELSQTKEKQLKEALASLALSYDPPVIGQRLDISQVDSFSFTAGRIVTQVAMEVSFTSPSRTLKYTYAGEGLLPEGYAEMNVSGSFNVKKAELDRLWEILQGCGLREEAADQDQDYICLIKLKTDSKVYYVDVDMAAADALVALFQEMRQTRAELSIPQKDMLAQYHGVSLMAALDGVKRVDLISAWGSPDSGIQASGEDIWYLSEDRQLEVYYQGTNGQVYDVFIKAREND